MTLLNAWKTGKQAHLFTDTAHLFRSGDVAAFGGKAIVAASAFPAVIGISWAGHTRVTLETFGEPFAEARCKNVTALTRLMPLACQNFCDKVAAFTDDKAYVRAIAVVWCSRTRSPRIFHCASTDEFGGALTTREVDYFLGGGSTSPKVADYGQRFAAGLRVNADSDAIAIADAQRVEPMDTECGWGRVYGIGGSLQKITVSRDGATGGIIHEWPDRVGEPIRVDQDPSERITLSEATRRAPRMPS